MLCFLQRPQICTYSLTYRLWCWVKKMCHLVHLSSCSSVLSSSLCFVGFFFFKMFFVVVVVPTTHSVWAKWCGFVHFQKFLAVNKEEKQIQSTWMLFTGVNRRRGGQMHKLRKYKTGEVTNKVMRGFIVPAERDSTSTCGTGIQIFVLRWSTASSRFSFVFVYSDDFTWKLKLLYSLFFEIDSDCALSSYLSIYLHEHLTY